MAIPTLDRASAIDSIRSDAQRIRTVALFDANAAVPRYPGHSVGDLITHLIVIYRWVSEIVTTRTHERIPQPRIDTSSWSVPDAIRNFDHALASLLSQIDNPDPSIEVWSFGSDHTVGFWQRRMAHETAMHRWDADSAIEATPHPIAAPIAVSGLAEALRIHVQRPLRRIELGGKGELILITCLDAPYSATIRFLEEGIEVHDQPSSLGRPDATIKGTAADLWMTITGRIPFASVDRSGDQQALDKFEASLQQIPSAI